MIITYYGHSLFALETAKGETIITDPYDESVGYPMGQLRGDIVTVSHEHHDHNNLSLIKGTPAVCRGTKVFTPLPGIRIMGYPSYHDGKKGAQRGQNTLFLIEADGLSILHLGDLGHTLDKEMIKALTPVDVLMVPVGGYYTIDAKEAAQVCRALGPKVIIPMHYRTAHSGGMPIAPVKDFLREMDASPQEMPLIRLTREDIGEQPPLALIVPRPIS